LLTTSAASTVVGTEAGYHPSALNPVTEMVPPFDLTSLEDCIAQLSFRRIFPDLLVCEKQAKEIKIGVMEMDATRYFISQIFNNC